MPWLRKLLLTWPSFEWPKIFASLLFTRSRTLPPCAQGAVLQVSLFDVYMVQEDHHRLREDQLNHRIQSLNEENAQLRSELCGDARGILSVRELPPDFMPCLPLPGCFRFWCFQQLLAACFQLGAKVADLRGCRSDSQVALCSEFRHDSMWSHMEMYDVYLLFFGNKIGTLWKLIQVPWLTERFYRMKYNCQCRPACAYTW